MEGRLASNNLYLSADSKTLYTIKNKKHVQVVPKPGGWIDVGTQKIRFNVIVDTVMKERRVAEAEAVQAEQETRPVFLPQVTAEERAGLFEQFAQRTRNAEEKKVAALAERTRLAAQRDNAIEEQKVYRAELLSNELKRKESSHEKMLQQVNALGREQTNQMISLNDFNNPFLMTFFQIHAEDILKRNNGCYMAIESNGTRKVIKVDQALLSDVNSFINILMKTDDDNQNTSDFTSKLIYNATRIVFMTPEYFNNIKSKLHLTESDDYYRQTNDGQLNVMDIAPDVKLRLKGKYFNYLNLIPTIDLTRYQIGQTLEEHLQLSEEHCFLYSLRMSGRYTDEQMNEISIQLLQSTELFSKTNIIGLPTIYPIKLTHYKPCGMSVCDVINEKNPGEPVQIGLFEKHYFINEPVNITLNYIKHYAEYKDNPMFLATTNLRAITISAKGTPSFQKADKHKTTSLELIKIMFDNNMFREITEQNKFNTQPAETQDIPSNYACDFNSRAGKATYLLQFNSVIFADFEAFTNRGEYDTDGHLKYTPHDPYMLCWSHGKNKRDGRNIYALINYLRGIYYNAGEKRILVLFHNFSYDSQFILHSELTFSKYVFDKSGNAIGLSMIIKTGDKTTITVQFADSYKILESSVKNMPKMFGLQDTAKEIFPYDYYTRDLYLENIGNISDALNFLPSVTRENFTCAIVRAGAQLDEEHFDMYKYSLFYCQRDVDIVQRSMTKFRQQILNDFNLDVYNYPTLSAASFDYFKQAGCFDDVVEVTGSVNKYLHQFVSGGVCMMADNKKQIIDTPVECLDFNMLYTAVQAVLPYPAGNPQKLSPAQVDYYNVPDNLMKITIEQDSVDQSLLFMNVRLIVGAGFKPRRFPVITQAQDGVHHNINEIDPQQVFHLTVFDLQNAVSFQGYEYEIIGGLYFAERQYTINDEMKKAFNTRMSYKNAGNKVEGIIKTFTNSNWGKTIQGVNLQKDVMIDKKDFEDFTQKNGPMLAKGFTVIGDKILFKLNKEKSCDWRYPHVGSLILSYARTMLFQVITLCEDNGINAYYTDTDSLFLDKTKVEMLDDLYFEKYGARIVGQGLGQMKSDFKSDAGTVVHATQSVFLGKKSYCNKLLLDNGQFDYKIRLVGITNDAVQERCSDFEIAPVQLYERMFGGEKIVMNMLSGNKPCFRKDHNKMTICQTEFYKTVSF